MSIVPNYFTGIAISLVATVFILFVVLILDNYKDQKRINWEMSHMKQNGN